jgi:hypothetical protein
VSVQGNPDRKVTYGELAQGKKIARLIDEKAVLRSVAQFKVMGKSPRRLAGRRSPAPPATPGTCGSRASSTPAFSVRPRTAPRP